MLRSSIVPAAWPQTPYRVPIGRRWSVCTGIRCSEVADSRCKMHSPSAWSWDGPMALKTSVLEPSSFKIWFWQCSSFQKNLCWFVRISCWHRALISQRIRFPCPTCPEHRQIQATCHSSDAEIARRCQSRCSRLLACGHPCSKRCCEECTNHCQMQCEQKLTCVLFWCWLSLLLKQMFFINWVGNRMCPLTAGFRGLSWNNSWLTALPVNCHHLTKKLQVLPGVAGAVELRWIPQGLAPWDLHIGPKINASKACKTHQNINYAKTGGIRWSHLVNLRQSMGFSQRPRRAHLPTEVLGELHRACCLRHAQVRCLYLVRSWPWHLFATCASLCVLESLFLKR